MQAKTLLRPSSKANTGPSVGSTSSRRWPTTDTALGQHIESAVKRVCSQPSSLQQGQASPAGEAWPCCREDALTQHVSMPNYL